MLAHKDYYHDVLYEQQADDASGSGGGGGGSSGPIAEIAEVSEKPDAGKIEAKAIDAMHQKAAEKDGDAPKPGGLPAPSWSELRDRLRAES